MTHDTDDDSRRRPQGRRPRFIGPLTRCLTRDRCAACPSPTARYTTGSPTGPAGDTLNWGFAVADDKRDTPRPFDVKTVEYLLRLMSDHDLSEVDLKEGDQRIRLRKGSPFPVGLAATPVVAHAPVPAAPPPAATGSPPSPPAKKFLEIKSELPGTFYTRPAPDKQPFVTVGSKVKPDTTVCYVTAMKVNNEIKAGVSGTIAEVVAVNDTFVDFGAVLFLVDPS